MKNFYTYLWKEKNISRLDQFNASERMPENQIWYDPHIGATIKAQMIDSRAYSTD